MAFRSSPSMPPALPSPSDDGSFVTQSETNAGSDSSDDVLGEQRPPPPSSQAMSASTTPRSSFRITSSSVPLPSSKRQRLNPPPRSRGQSTSPAGRRLRKSLREQTDLSIHHVPTTALQQIELRQRERTLATAHADDEKVKAAFDRGLEKLHDAELEEVLELACKYGPRMEKLFLPGMQEFLKRQGIGAGYQGYYTRAWTEGNRREGFGKMEFEMEEDVSKKVKGDERLQLGRARNQSRSGRSSGQHSETPVSSVTPSIRSRRSSSEARREPAPNAVSTSGGAGLNGIRTRRGINAEFAPLITGGKSAPTPLPLHDSKRTGNSIDKLAAPEVFNISSRFFCRQCRKGPAICMHRHRMIMDMLKDSSDISTLDLMFAKHLLDDWDHGGRGDFGIEPCFLRHFTNMEIMIKRRAWATKLNDLIDQRKSADSDFLAAVVSFDECVRKSDEVLGHALDAWNAKNDKKARLGRRKIESWAFQEMPDAGTESTEDEGYSTHSRKYLDNLDDTSRGRKRQRGESEDTSSGPRRPARFKNGMRESPINVSRGEKGDLVGDENDHGERLSVYDSDSSDDSLIQSSRNSLDVAISEASPERLYTVAKTLLRNASASSLAEAIKGLCHNNDFAIKCARKLLGEQLHSSESVSLSADIQRKLLSQKVSRDQEWLQLNLDAAQRKSIDDRISSMQPTAHFSAPPSRNSTKPGTVECEACQTYFDPTSSRQLDECLHHPGDLVKTWKQQESVKRDFQRNKIGPLGLLWKCCGSEGKSPGCVSGQHIVPLKKVDSTQTSGDGHLDHPDTIELVRPSLEQTSSLSDSRPALLSNEDKSASNLATHLKSSQGLLQGAAAVGDNEFKKYPDYSPDMSLLAAMSTNRLLEPLNNPTSAPLDLSSDPQQAELHPYESELAGLLKWTCSYFLLRKRLLFAQCLESHRRGVPFLPTRFCTSISGSKEKLNVLFAAYAGIGWLDSIHFDEFLKQKGAKLAPAAATPISENQPPHKRSPAYPPTSHATQEIEERQGGSASKNKSTSFPKPPTTKKTTFWTKDNLDYLYAKAGEAQARLQPLNTPLQSQTSQPPTPMSQSHRSSSGTPYEKHWSSHGAADRELVAMRRSGKNWDACWTAWCAHGTSGLKDKWSLAMRYSKLKRLFEKEWETESGEGREEVKR